MRTTIYNCIPFEDNADTTFLLELRKIFPLFHLEVWVQDFKWKRTSSEDFSMVVKFEIQYRGENKELEYKKVTSDLQLVKSFETDKGMKRRKAIINMLQNDTFIEEVSELMDEFEYEY